jgi:hypothetical protein
MFPLPIQAIVIFIVPEDAGFWFIGIPFVEDKRNPGLIQ